MSSENKKRKARNSYIMNGGEKNAVDEWKCRRIAYFTKRDRLKDKRRVSKMTEESA